MGGGTQAQKMHQLQPSADSDEKQIKGVIAGSLYISWLKGHVVAKFGGERQSVQETSCNVRELVEPDRRLICLVQILTLSPHGHPLLIKEMLHVDEQGVPMTHSMREHSEYLSGAGCRLHWEAKPGI